MSLAGPASRLFALALALASAGCTHVTREVGTEAPAPLPDGRVALRFERVDGAVETLGALRGRVVVLAVITTWAEPALVEVPELKELHAAYPRDDLEIVSLVLDDKPEMAKIFQRTFEIPYVVGTVEDRAAFSGEGGPLGAIRIIPTSYLLDREGHIAARMEGTWPAGSLAKAVRQLVGAGHS